MESASQNIALGKVLIVAKNEVAINTAQASVDSFKKKGQYCCSFHKTESIITLKGDSLYSIAKTSWDNDFRY
jgi:membrane-bound lytic murein transglycosylase D